MRSTEAGREVNPGRPLFYWNLVFLDTIWIVTPKAITARSILTGSLSVAKTMEVNMVIHISVRVLIFSFIGIPSLDM